MTREESRARGGLIEFDVLQRQRRIRRWAIGARTLTQTQTGKAILLRAEWLRMSLRWVRFDCGSQERRL